MLRRIKRFLGISTHSYFPNNEVAPTADGSILSTNSRKSTKSERKAAKKEKKKSPLAADTSAPAIFHAVSALPTDIVVCNQNPINQDIDSQTVITDSLPYREPSDKVIIEGPIVSEMPETNSSTRSIVGSESIKSRFEAMGIDGGSPTLPNVESVAESVYSADFSQDTDSQNSNMMCDSKSRELPVDCDIANDKPPMEVSPIASRISATSSVYMVLTKVMPEEEMAEKSDEVNAMKKFNDELDSLLTKSAPPFQVSTARLPPMLKELPPPAQDDSMLSGADEFDDSKNNSSVNNSVARMVNESHEVMMRSPENKHLRSCGY